MARAAAQSVHALCAAWGQARTAIVPVPELIPIEQVIPGYWRHLLSARRSELVGVLPGRREEHVQALTATYASERRDSGRLVRSDFAQAWTRYAQEQPTDVRRDAERAVAAWLTHPRPMHVETR
jgi:hypothetical protein